MRVTVTFQVHTNDSESLTAIREDLAMVLERWGDVALLWMGSSPDVEQITLPGASGKA